MYLSHDTTNRDMTLRQRQRQRPTSRGARFGGIPIKTPFVYIVFFWFFKILVVFSCVKGLFFNKMRCSVAGCNSDNGLKSFTSDVMLFRFPKDENIQKRWVIACKRADHINVKTARVCSKHFNESSYERNLRFELLGYTARNRRLLKRDAVPFLNLPMEKSRDVKGKLARSSRIVKRDQSKLVETLLQARETANEVDQDLKQKFTMETQSYIKSEEENLETHTEVKHVKTELDDFDNRETTSEGDPDLDLKSTIKIEEEDLVDTPYLISYDELDLKSTIKSEEDLKTVNDVDQDLDQKSAIKSEEGNFINSQYLISHEEVDIKSEDDVEQSDSQGRQINKRVAAHSTQPNTTVQLYKCNNCGDDIDDRHKCPDRVKKDQIKIYKCLDCPYHSKYKKNVKQHSIQHRKPEDIAWHHCAECPYKTKWKGNLKLHVEGHNEIFKCAHCDYKTSRKPYLTRHLLMHCGKNIPRIHCPEPECPYKTNDKTKLKRHSLVHNNDQFFKCNQCPYQAKYRFILKRHQLKHDSTDKWHACSQCPFKSIYKSSLNQHVRTHANPDQLTWFMCKQCPFKSSRKHNLTEHAFSHNKDHTTWLQCTTCSFKTPHKYYFRRHQMKHQEDDDHGPGLYKCPECPYKAWSKSHLRVHSKNHKAADKTDWLQCPKCSYRTSRTRHLKAHQMLHTSVVE